MEIREFRRYKTESDRVAWVDDSRIEMAYKNVVEAMEPAINFVKQEKKTRKDPKTWKHKSWVISATNAPTPHAAKMVQAAAEHLWLCLFPPHRRICITNGPGSHFKCAFNEDRYKIVERKFNIVQPSHTLRRTPVRYSEIRL